MEYIAWLVLILAGVFIGFFLLIVGTLRKGRLGINLKSVHCPSCDTPMSARRVPSSRSHRLFGGWTCPHCGTKMDKWGRSEGSEISISRSRPL
jgi:hypothetical protein